MIYRAFVDAAGGGPDSYTISIGHKEGDVYIIDVVRGTSGKFDPQSVTEEYAKLCRQYRIRSVTGDNYARDWVAGAWRKLGFEYIRSSRPKGAIYLESLPVFTRGLARLPHFERTGFAALELAHGLINAAAGVDTRSSKSIFDSASQTPPLRMHSAIASVASA